jgi:hypothetical protein
VGFLAPITVIPLHLGTLHPVEQALVLLLAFGPFVVLGVVVRHQRRRDAEQDEPPRPD